MVMTTMAVFDNELAQVYARKPSNFARDISNPAPVIAQLNEQSLVISPIG
jgi:hypothetical protein